MVQLISLITLGVTVLLSFSLVILRTNRLIIFNISPRIKASVLENSFLRFCLLLSLFIYRSFCQLPNWVFYAFVLANTSMMLNFFFTRLYIISLGDTNLTWNIYIPFFLVFLSSTILGIIRFLFNLGFQIDKYPHVVLVVLERFTQSSANIFSRLGKRVSAHLPQSPGSSGIDKHFALGVGTFVAASVAAGSGVYLGYEAYKSRMINLRSVMAAEESAKAAQQSAKAALATAVAEQQKTDIKAVKHGLMSTEEYSKKYPTNIVK